MKKISIKITAALLALLMLALAFASCSAVSKPAASLENNTVTVGMYSLMASILKGSLAYGNSSVHSPSFWQTVVDKDTGKTYEEFYNEFLLESVKNNLYKLAIFDELGLSLPQSTIDKIDEDLAFWVDYDGEGSMNNFNAILSDYGANYDVLREYMIMSAKIDYTVQYLYGGGSKLSDSVKQQYLKESYVCFKQILFPYFDYVYETDEFGNDIYYYPDTEEEKDKICYDPSNKDATTADSDGDGKPNRDENGDVIWYVEDENGKVSISYDKANGMRRNVYDDDGNAVTKEFSAAKKSEVWKEAEDVLGQTQEGNFNGFEALMLVYDGNYGNTEGTDIAEERVYLNTEVAYSSLYGDDTVEKLGTLAKGLSVGGIAKYESDYGVHLIMRYEVEDKAWANEAYRGYFEDETGSADFNTLIINSLFLLEVKKIREKLGEVTVDTEAIAGISIKDVGINYNFY